MTLPPPAAPVPPWRTPTPPPAELDAAGQAVLLQALRRQLALAHPQAPVQVVETHISHVLLAGGQAWKLHKALKLDFLDFSTLAQRHHNAQEEWRLNRRLAPALYLGVVPVTGTPQAPALGGPGPVLDWAVHMRAFDPGQGWDRLLARGALPTEAVDALAVAVHRFQQDHAAVAGPDSPWGRPDDQLDAMTGNFPTLRAGLTEPADQARLDALQAWVAKRGPELAPEMARRRQAGCVREGHGDLHTGNVAEVDGVTTPFDCIEFNPAFRWIDVISEVAFMAMDLHQHGRPDLAQRFLNRWLEASGDYDGVRLLRWHLVQRALVRAKVTTLRAGQTGLPADWQAARALLAWADETTRPAPPRLMITHGVSGSGKTRGTQAVVEHEGALRVRADVERKRLHGLTALQRPADAAAGALLYGDAANEATQARLLAAAEAVLAGGWPVVLDATHIQRRRRDAAAALAHRLGVAFEILDFPASPPVLRQRLQQRAARGDDASDADVAVLERQLVSAEPLTPAEQALCRRASPEM